MNIYTSEVEMLRAQCREWEKVCNSHLRLIKKLKKERTWAGLTDEDFLEACQLAENGNYLVAFRRIQAKLKEKNT